MNWIKISGYILGGAGLIFMALSNAADIYFKTASKKKALEARTEEETERYERAKNDVASCDAREKREGDELASKIDVWKRDSGYTVRMSQIRAEEDNGIAAFKRSIGYEREKQAIQDREDNDIAAWKASCDYDANLSYHQARIRDAQNLYDRKKRLCSLGGEELSETAEALRQAAAKERDKVVNESKDEIRKLKDALNTKTQKARSVSQRELKELEERVLNEKTRLKAKYDEETKKLNSELSSFRASAQKEIFAERSEEEEACIRSYGDNKSIIRQQENLDAQRQMDIYANAPLSERFAEYLKSCECPKWLVAVLGAAPLVPVAYLTKEYICFLGRVLKSM